MDTLPRFLKGESVLDKEQKPLTADKVGDGESVREKKPWQPLKLTYTGEAKDVVQSGGGKQSPGLADPGDLRKPPGQN